MKYCLTVWLGNFSSDIYNKLKYNEVGLFKYCIFYEMFSQVTQYIYFKWLLWVNCKAIYQQYCNFSSVADIYSESNSYTWLRTVINCEGNVTADNDYKKKILVLLQSESNNLMLKNLGRESRKFEEPNQQFFLPRIYHKFLVDINFIRLTYVRFLIVFGRQYTTCTRRVQSAEDEKNGWT